MAPLALGGRLGGRAREAVKEAAGDFRRSPRTTVCGVYPWGWYIDSLTQPFIFFFGPTLRFALRYFFFRTC